MLSGKLLITSDPSTICFYWDGNNSAYRGFGGTDDVRNLLLELDAISPVSKWPLRDYQVLLSGKFSNALLEKYGLLPFTLSQPDQMDRLHEAS